MNNLSYIRSKETHYTEYKTIPQKLKEIAQTKPNKEFVVIYTYDGLRRSITYSTIHRRSQQFGGVLSKLGVHKGDRVIVYLYNSIDYLIIVFGLMSIGAVPVSSYIMKTDLSDLDHVLQKTHAVGLFFTEHDADIKPALKRIIQNGFNRVKFAVSTDILDDDDPILSYRKMVKQIESDVTCNDVKLDPDDEAYIFRTSGSTGLPKLVSHSHMSLRNGINFYENVGQKRFHNFEFSYIDGTPLIEICTEGTQVSVCGNPTKESVHTLLQYASIESCDTLELSQYAMNVLLKEKLEITPSIKTMIVGGAPIKAKLQYFLEKVECLRIYYGTCEVIDVSKTVVKKGMALEDNIGGFPSPNIEIKIVDSNDVVVERGTHGRIFVRSPYIFLEYLDDEWATKDQVNLSRWYHTGDIGYISQCGKLFVIGREGECIAHGCHIFYASDLENAIEDSNIACMKDCVIVPVPDELYNEEICACIIRKSEYTTTEKEMLQLIKNSVLEYCFIPKYVVLVESFPTTSSGKINRQKLADIATKLISE